MTFNIDRLCNVSRVLRSVVHITQEIKYKILLEYN